MLKTTQEQTVKTLRTKEDLMVEENLLRLEIRRLRQALSHKADSVLSLEQRKLQLETAMKVRAASPRRRESPPGTRVDGVGRKWG